MHCGSQLWELEVSHFPEHRTLLRFPPGEKGEHTSAACPEEVMTARVPSCLIPPLKSNIYHFVTFQSPRHVQGDL